jgi:hypothetical protein
MQSVCLKLCLKQGESAFRLRNFNIVSFYYLFNCDTCFGHTTIFSTQTKTSSAVKQIVETYDIKVA